MHVERTVSPSFPAEKISRFSGFCAQRKGRPGQRKQTCFVFFFERGDGVFRNRFEKVQDDIDMHLFRDCLLLSGELKEDGRKTADQ